MSYQQPNTIIIEDKIYSTLSGYLPHENQEINEIKNNQYIKALTKEEWKDKYLNNKSVYKRSTACYRRYFAKWEIEDDKLYLLDLEGEYELNNSTKLFANWFSGEIKIGVGQIVIEKRDINMPYGIYYSKVWHIKIDKGIVVNQYIENK